MALFTLPFSNAEMDLDVYPVSFATSVCVLDNDLLKFLHLRPNIFKSVKSSPPYNKYGLGENPNPVEV